MTSNKQFEWDKENNRDSKLGHQINLNFILSEIAWKHVF